MRQAFYGTWTGSTDGCHEKRLLVHGVPHNNLAVCSPSCNPRVCAADTIAGAAATTVLIVRIGS